MFKPIQDVVAEAFQASRNAAAEYIATNGERAPFGYAWVDVGPCKSDLARYLNALPSGYHNATTGGVDVWKPGAPYTTSLHASVEGARAFAKVLIKYGYRAELCSGTGEKMVYDLD